MASLKLGLWLLLFSNFWIPASGTDKPDCRLAYFCLIDGCVSADDLATLRRLVQLPPKELRREISRLGSKHALDLAVASLRLMAGSPGPDGAQASSDLTPRLGVLARWLGRSIGRDAPPAEKRAAARRLLASLRDSPSTWEAQRPIDELIDAVMGMRGERVTNQVRNQPDQSVRSKYGNEQTWFRFGNRDLLTPYFEFQLALDKAQPQPEQTIVDLGSGLGRQGAYVGLMYPKVKFVGYELVSERVKEAERVSHGLGLDNVEYHEQNLAAPDFKPVPADIYYAFNPVTGPTFDKIISDIKEQSVLHHKPFKIVVSGPSPYEKFERPDSGFREITPERRFPDDDFTRIFEFDPARPRARAAGPALGENEIPNFPAARPLRQEDRKFFTDETSAFSHVTFPSLWAWHGRDDYRITRVLGLPVISGRIKDKRVFIEPLSGTLKERADAIRFAILSALPGSEPVSFTYVSEPVAKILAKDPALKVHQDPALADYVYSAEGMATLSVPEGKAANNNTRKRLKQKRQQADEFGTKFPGAAYVPLESAMEPEAEAFLKKWEADNAGRIGPEGLEECRVAENMLKNSHELGLVGRAVLVNGKIAAFELGRVQNGSFVIYVNKADSSAPGIYPWFFRETGREARDRGLTLNLQDDGGVKSLRQVKQALNPERQLSTYEVEKGAL